jgi:TPR repeat protein
MPETREKFPRMQIFLLVCSESMRILTGLLLLMATITLLGAQDAALSPDALYSRGLARTIPPNQDFVEAANLFRQAADRGNVRAQRSLGELYLHGRGVEKNEAEAAKWLKKAADKGDAQAQSGLGSLFFSGLGVKKDEKEALKWYKKAAEQGEMTSQVSLGLFYMKSDMKAALLWFRKAAEQGSALAQFTLGSIYEGRRGVPANRAEAAGWYTKALQQGFEEARKPLEALRSLGLVPPDEAAANLLTPMVRIDPPLARAARINDEVIFEITVDTSGVVKAYKITYGHPLLNEAAIASVKPLRYKPYLVNGQPVEFVTSVTLKFSY